MKRESFDRSSEQIESSEQSEVLTPVDQGIEKSLEQEVSPNDVLLEGTQVEQDLNEELDRFNRETEQRMRESMIERGLEDSDLNMQEISQELSELSVLHSRADELHKEQNQKLGGFLQGLAKIFGSRTVAGVSLLKAITFSEACSGVEDLVNTEKIYMSRPTPEDVKRKALEGIIGNPDLMNEISEENFNTLIEVIKAFDEEKVNDALYELSDLDKEDVILDEENLIELRFLSKEQVQQEAKKDPLLGEKYTAVTQHDRLWFNVEKLNQHADEMFDGQYSKNDLLVAMVHEKLHAATTDSQSISSESGPQEGLWDRYDNISHELLEGVTELTAQRTAEHLGMKPIDQAYAGGPFMAAYFLESIAGTEAMVADYLSGDTKRMQEEVNKKFGPGSFEKITQDDLQIFHKKNIFATSPSGLFTIQKIIEHCKESGVDYNEIVQKAEQEGIKEQVHVLSEGKDIILTKEIGEKLRIVNGVFDTGYKISEHSPNLRITLWTTGYSDFKTLDDLQGKCADIVSSSKRIERSYSVVEDAQEQDPNLDTEDAHRKLINLDRGEFNIVYNIKEQIQDFQQEYESAKTDSEKKEIQNRVFEKMKGIEVSIMQHVQETISQLE